MLFKISRKKEKTQFNNIDLTVLNLFDFILGLTFYIMTLLEYLALNTHEKFKYFSCPFHIHVPNQQV